MMRFFEKYHVAIVNAAFIFFLATIPLSLRKVFFYYPMTPIGGFNDYTDASLYLSDIALLVFSILAIAEYKTKEKSIMFHVEHKWYLVLPGILVTWGILSIFWSENQTLAILASVKQLEFFVLYIAIICYFVPRGTSDDKSVDSQMFHVEQRSHSEESGNVPRGTINVGSCLSQCSTWNKKMVIIFSLAIICLIQAVIVLFQFIEQKSIGLKWLGESALSNVTPGVAKVVVLGDSIMRAYGTFPHPNVLAAFLGITMVFLIGYPQTAHGFSKLMFHVEHAIVVISIGIVFFLAFSKAAFLALFLSLGFIFYKMFHVEQKRDNLRSSILNVPRGTISDGLQLLKKCSTWNKCFLLTAALFFSIAIVLNNVNLHYLLIQPAEERVIGYKTSFEMAMEHPLTGIGTGQFVTEMQQFISFDLLDWQFQPVHNVFLLVLSELGVVGLGIYLLFLFLVYSNVPRGTSSGVLSKALLLFLFTLMFFDHYLWDIQQGQLMLWIVIGYIVAHNMKPLTKQQNVA